MKDFFSHIDLITHAGSELLQDIADDPDAADDTVIASDLLASLTYGHVRRLRKAIEEYHIRYSEADSGAVQKLLALDEEEAGDRLD